MMRVAAPTDFPLILASVVALPVFKSLKLIPPLLLFLFLFQIFFAASEYPDQS